MRLVVGLGNPGTEYARTRHNAGVIFIKQLAREYKVKFTRLKRAAFADVINKFPEHVILAVPKTYMNKSGVAVKYLVNRFRVAGEDLVVVYDDFDLELGDIRIRKKGSAGSHKGLRSIIQEMGTQEFARIRIGIGPLPQGDDAADFVLSPFTKDERPFFKESLEKASCALDLIFTGAIDEAMNKYNARSAALADD